MVSGSNHLIAAYYSFIDPERTKGWVDLHQLQVKRRPVKGRQSKTDVLPLSYTNMVRNDTYWHSYTLKRRLVVGCNWPCYIQQPGFDLPWPCYIATQQVTAHVLQTYTGGVLLNQPYHCGTRCRSLFVTHLWQWSSSAHIWRLFCFAEHTGLSIAPSWQFRL